MIDRWRDDAGREIHARSWYTVHDTWSGQARTIGVIVLVDRTQGWWKAYVGLGSGLSEEADAHLIVAGGSRVHGPIAVAAAGRLADGLEQSV